MMLSVSIVVSKKKKSFCFFGIKKQLTIYLQLHTFQSLIIVKPLNILEAVDAPPYSQSNGWYKPGLYSCFFI